MAESRVKKSLLNARVNLLFYFLSLGLSFFSRKIFLNSLGADFLGLSGTLVNILGFLSLAEMGIGTAVAFNLYKPLLDGNKQKINEIVSVFGFLYNRIGIFISIAALILSAFIPLIFKNANISLGIIYFAFFSVLFSSLCGHFINYRQILLSADQKNYLVTKYLQSAILIKLVAQMAVAYFLESYYLWIALEIIFAILSCIVLNSRIDKEYPWLHVSVKLGKQAYPQNKQIITYTKQIFIHKLKDFLLSQSDQILVFAFVSLKMVAFYGNYTLITTKVSQIFLTAMEGFSASVGNLVAEGNKEKIMKVFWEIYSINFIIGGLLVFSLYHLLEPFIILWLGKEYILEHTILILLLINIFIMETRKSVDMFNNAYGHYADTWSAWVEGGINLSVTIITAIHWGIIGILLGKIISLVVIVVLWKPYYLFKSGFKEKISVYWKGVALYATILAISFLGIHYLITLLPINPYQNFIAWIGYATCTILCFMSFYMLGLYYICPGTKDLIKRIKPFKTFFK